MAYSDFAPLAGVLIGGLLTGGFSLLNGRVQRQAAQAAEGRAVAETLLGEQRQREAAASAQARDALSKLLLMRRDPDYDRRRNEYQLHRRRGLSEDTFVRELELLGQPDEAADAAWRHERDLLVMAVDNAVGDLSDHDLRTRLNEVCDMLRLYGGPEKYTHQMEARTRYLAARHGFDCLGAFRRDESLPERSTEYRETLDLVEIYLDEIEANSRH